MNPSVFQTSSGSQPSKSCAPNAVSPILPFPSLNLSSQLRDQEDGLTTPPNHFTGEGGSRIDNPGYVTDKPTTEHGKYFAASVDKWALQAPYDTSIAESDWKKYYKRRLKVADKLGKDIFSATTMSSTPTTSATPSPNAASN